MSGLDHCPECGCELPAPKQVKSRSYVQLKRIHALCREAFFHWPESAEFRPKDPQHLRYFLEMEAGYFTVVKTTRINPGDIDPSRLTPFLTSLLSAVLRNSDDDKMFVDVDGLLVTVKKVGSIAYEELEHGPACDLFNKVDEVLHRYGLDAEKLLREARKAA